MDATMQRTLIWAGFSLALALLAIWRPNAGRAAIGAFFLLMAVGVNIVTTVVNPQSYGAWADTALLPAYREVILRFVAPNPAPLVLPVAAYQIAVAVALVQRGRVVTLGLVGAMVFLLAIMPLGWEEMANVVLIAGLALLLRRDYPHSIAALVRAGLRRPPAPVPRRGGDAAAARSPRL
jgi:hypothetical protein